MPLVLATTMCGLPAALPNWQPSTAVSQNAELVSSALTEISGQTIVSQSLFGKRLAALAELNKIAAQSAEDNWDGDDALAMNPNSKWRTERIINVLPGYITPPEIAVTPDGSVMLDWVKSPKNMFSVIVNPSGYLSYAWTNSDGSGNAVATFDEKKVAETLLHGLENFLG